MQANILKNSIEKAPVIHPLNQEDSIAVAAQRAAAAPMKGRLRDTAARDGFNHMMILPLII